ncbi:alanine--tRNA ligase [candidate division KSB1 bacterium]|nr:MAG: alanine--tRNA ligase [candidate division KSB1 bacterium]
MKADEVRKSFIDFFRDKGHKIVKSAPVVPQNDPTLLFTNAGMNQFKDVFLGTGTRPYSRAVDSQKCIRVSGKHNDLEAVGNDTYHHTFFEMLGNWSFGDYYKKEAITWAWELVTKVWGLPKERLYATVFREDDEAEEIWRNHTDIDNSHVLKFDEKDNFWEMGATGPCGPCSEIHIDLGEGYCDKQHIPGHKCTVNGGCSRIIELWNLVFIQYERREDGSTVPLPQKHVDTGLGLERAAAVLQGKRSNYQTDLFMPILRKTAEISGRSFEDESLVPAFRVIADHIRALTFAITDGVIPSNEGRGYVIRRILRRASRYGRKLSMHEPFLYKLVPVVIDVMGHAYPEIKERLEHTSHVIKSEEDRFNDVLDRGLEIFEEISGKVLSSGKKEVSGEDVFKLYDTYGFPVDLTKILALEKGLDIDEQGFEKELEKQRQRARSAASFNNLNDADWQEITSGEDSEFIGYDSLSCNSEVRKVRTDNDSVTLLLDKTPFYAESGGQVGDKGIIKGKDFTIRIDDTLRTGGQILHIGKFTKGTKITDPEVFAEVDKEARTATARNHTATHLLHRALKNILGEHVNQAGSLVTPEYFRFDFTHYGAMTEDELAQAEYEVNVQIMNDHPVSTRITSYDDAKKEGAVALFGEKYGDNVRVVKVNNYSMELCGGTHIDRTGKIGYFRILKEEAVAAGVRRIEAVTGTRADKILREEKEILQKIEKMLKCGKNDIESRIEGMIEERKNLERRIKKLQYSSSGSVIEEIIKNSVKINSISVAAGKVEAETADDLRTMGDKLRDKLKSGVGVLGNVSGGKVTFVCIVTDDLIKSHGLNAGLIIKEVAAIAGGGGGGRPHLATAGGRNPEKLEEALKAAPDVVKKMIKS